jgi:GcrA cell cycle regulator
MSGWTDEKVETLKRLHFNDYSFSEIANVLGMTRNACIGKASRLGLSKPSAPVFRNKPEPSKAKAKTPQSPKHRPQPQPIERMFPEPQPAVGRPGGVTILDLEQGMCRWPIGEVGEESFRFCGDAALDSKSYCNAHFRLSCSQTWFSKAPEGRRMARVMAQVMANA